MPADEKGKGKGPKKDEGLVELNLTDVFKEKGNAGQDNAGLPEQEDIDAGDIDFVADHSDGARKGGGEPPERRGMPGLERLMWIAVCGVTAAALYFKDPITDAANQTADFAKHQYVSAVYSGWRAIGNHLRNNGADVSGFSMILSDNDAIDHAAGLVSSGKVDQGHIIKLAEAVGSKLPKEYPLSKMLEGMVSSGGEKEARAYCANMTYNNITNHYMNETGLAEFLKAVVTAMDKDGLDTFVLKHVAESKDSGFRMNVTRTAYLGLPGYQQDDIIEYTFSMIPADDSARRVNAIKTLTLKLTPSELAKVVGNTSAQGALKMNEEGMKYLETDDGYTGKVFRWAYSGLQNAFGGK